MSTNRLLSLVSTWIVLALVAGSFTDDWGLLIDLRVLAFVLALPWLGVALAASPRAALDAMVDGWRPNPDLPSERRATSAALLHTVGGASFAAGLLSLLLGMIVTLNVVAASPGQASPLELVSAFGGLVLGPLYGLALMSFLYQPLSAGLEGDGQGLGTEL
ncbi:MAG: hypothetical protein VYE81_07715 [Planctomycetota bacterium]|nr:hypothetical protein [Planctomycetota bacterium]